MIDTEALRKKVIDLSIRGKLTEQLPEDGTAEELYAQIQEEKARLVQEGKTKKPKPLPEIAADEIPFEIPRNWKWVHLNAIATSSLGKTLNKSTDKGDICKYLCSINVQWNKINLDTVKTARFENDEKEKYRLRKGDLLICEGGDSGRSAIWDSDEEMYYQNALHRVRFVGGISPWLYCYIMEYYKKSGIISFYTKGIGIQHLVQSALNAIWLPLPPLDEQIRIVDKVRTAFQQIDIIDAFQSQYCNNLESLKSKIIDAGIRGKLTEQLPTDGTAEELYAQILEEKARLVKEKKIKKEKPLPAITEDEIPFEIPKNWKWVHFADIALHVSTGPFGTMLHKADYCLDGIPLVNPSHMINGKIVPANNKRVNAETLLRLSGYKLKENDLVLARRGELGRCAVVTSKEDGWLCGTGSFFAHFGGGIIPQYIYSVFQTDTVRSRLMVSSVGAT